MSGRHGKMSGTLRITAAWAHLINKLFGAKSLTPDRISAS